MPSPKEAEQRNPRDNVLVSRRSIRTIRPVPRVVKALLASLLPLWIAGCANAPQYAAKHPSSTIRIEDVAAPMPVAPAAPLPEPSPIKSPETVVTNHIETLPIAPATSTLAWPVDWVNVWLPLETWGQFNGLGKPVQFGGGSDIRFELPTTNGPMRLRPGSHILEFGGHDFWLGFAPRMMKGFPYVHSIDARKTLQPLLNASTQLPVSNRIIVLDPGHGGRDGGAQSCSDGAHEKDYALDWARRLAPLLRECGWTVVLTRTNDSYLTLADRVAVADRVNAEVFLSLHFNSAAGNDANAGVETYCLTPTGMPSSLLRGEDDPREAHPNNAFDEQNFQLATALHRTIVNSTGAPDRGVGRARFMGVLRGQNRPAVLIEGGYLTNPQEARRIASPEYRQALAEGVARALQ